MRAGRVPAHNDHTSHLSPLCFRQHHWSTFVAAMVAPRGPECHYYRPPVLDDPDNCYPIYVCCRASGSGRIACGTLRVMFEELRNDRTFWNRTARVDQRSDWCPGAEVAARPKSEQHATRDTAVVRSGIEAEERGFESCRFKGRPARRSVWGKLAL